MPFLWLTRFAPYAPLNGGDYDYSRGLLHALAREGAVRALAFEMPGVTPPPHDRIGWEFVPYRRHSPLFSLGSTLPDVAFRFRRSGYLARAVTMAASASAIYVDFIGMAWIVKPLRRALDRAGLSMPIVMITHNHEGSLRRGFAAKARWPMRAVLTLDAIKAGRLERQASRHAHAVTAIVEEDAAIIRSECATPVTVLLPGSDEARRPTRRIGAETPLRAALIGNRRAAHKIAVLEHALGAFHAAGTDEAVPIVVAGDGDFAGMAQRYPAVRFDGFVKDLPSWLDGFRLALIPDDMGGGFKLRVLTLALQRMPILGLREAMVGTTLVPGLHYHAVDTLEEMATVMPALIRDTERLDMLQEAAFAHCATHFDWADRGRALAAIAQGQRPGPHAPTVEAPLTRQARAVPVDA